ncbi:AT-rich interactive domain-containing protein 4-like isoform X2 [Olea europaea var. sylvestris]|uniref:AT-rich interactive domain-containing protein 4-like isoform X2 n=1 Tax=Olea europaea var. sylvestris TaxID=158386 RepID=UPI000C1D1192|nr:AT-rich interactive domain-containing protein 4-like isoform X2 [Olea europaea var. sylvestris]
MNNGPAASMPMTNQMHQFWKTALLMPTEILFTMLNIPAGIKCAYFSLDCSSLYFGLSCSSYCHTCDVFQLAHASFRLHCIQSNLVLHDNTLEVNDKLGPNLLGEPPNISVTLPEMGPEDDEERASGDLPAVKIYDDDINMRFLVCGVASSLDAFLLGSLEDGLNALLVQIHQPTCQTAEI